MKARKSLCLVLVIALVFSLCVPAMATDTTASLIASNPTDDALSIADAATSTFNVTLDGKTLGITMKEDKYCANPNSAEQMISIYIPANATSDSAVLFCVNNSGWQSDSYAARTQVEAGKAYVSNSNTDKVGAALARGMIIVSYGCRSRNDAAVDGDYLGHSPATMTDTKAAIRYLRYNEVGDTDRIVITGTSGGGGLSAQIASSGNSSDYYESLYEIGAAGITKNANGTYTSTISDAVEATIAYCPINDLGNANAGYEATYNLVRQTLADKNIPQGETSTYSSADIIAASNVLAAEYGEYVDSLGLKGLTSKNLQQAAQALIETELKESIAEYGVDQMKADLEAFIKSSNTPSRKPYMTEDPAPKTADDPTYLSGYDFLTLNEDGTYSYDYTSHLVFLATSTELKPAPSFSNKGMSNVGTMMNEDSLFGTEEYAYSAFCEYSWNNDNTAGNGCGKDDTGLDWDAFLKTDAGKDLSKQLKMASPIPYLTSSTKQSDVAPYWYVRHGLADRDTSFAVQTVLYYSIKENSQVKNCNFEFTWFKPHSGDYDIQEAFTWLDSVIGTSVVGTDANPLSMVNATATGLTVKVDGKALKVTEYVDCYVTNPTNVAMVPNADGIDQKIDIYVPENATGESPILFCVNNGGWLMDAWAMRTTVQDGKEYSSTSDDDILGAALARGYVIVSLGARSRNDNADANGDYISHCPATMTDTKAAIRFLRYNAELNVLPAGDTDYICITGTSGGGALSTIIAASGNSSDYYASLYEIGAAGITKNANGTYASTLGDNVYATVAYCPINDLRYASEAYEWTYNETRQAMIDSLGEEAANAAFQDAMTDEYTLEDMMTASSALKDTYSAYVDSLGLKLDDGTALTSKNLEDAIIALLKTEIEESIKEVGIDQMKTDSTSVPAAGDNLNYTSASEGWKTWLTINDDGTYTFDYDSYLYWLAMNKKLKVAPAFTNLGMGIASQNEDSLYGTTDYQYSAFGQYAWDNDSTAGNGCGKDDTGLTWKEFIKTDAGKAVLAQCEMSSPIPYLTDSSKGATVAPYWYVRHGMADRDTSFALQTVLRYAISNNKQVKDLNFEFAWIKPHSGNYDVQEAMAYLDTIMPKVNPFVDLTQDWYKTAVNWAVENGVTSGTSAITFGPTNTLTYAQMVTFMYAAAGSPNGKAATGENWWAKAQAWAISEGYITASQSMTAPINRLDVVKMLYAHAGSPAVTATSPFTDCNDAAAIWAYQKGLTAGVGNNLFAPTTSLNRATAVTFIYAAVAK